MLACSSDKNPAKILILGTRTISVLVQWDFYRTGKKMSKHILQYQPNVKMLTFLLTSWSRICYLPVFVIVYIFSGGCDQTLSSTFCTLLINLRSCGKKQKSCSPFIILVGFLTVLRKGQLQQFFLVIYFKLFVHSQIYKRPPKFSPHISYVNITI